MTLPHVLVGLTTSVLFIVACSGGDSPTDERNTAPPRTATAAQGVPVPPAFATELALGGSFETTEEAEAQVGYRLLRPDMSQVVVGPGWESGSVDVFPEIGLPRVRQSFKLSGNDRWLDLVQEPQSYPLSPNRGDVSSQLFGAYEGELEQDGDNISFDFLTGESLQGVPIRASVISLGGHSVDDIRRFVESLAFE